MPHTQLAIASNRLLDALPVKDRHRIVTRCDQIELVSADILHEAGARQRHVYFPTEAFISMVTPLEVCPSLEVVLVGNEGMVGVSVVLGVAASPLRQRVQGGGGALRISAASLRRELDHGAALRLRLNRYAFVKMQQIAQTAACIYFHQVDSRLARLLLMLRDRSHSDRLLATHAFLAQALGVRRASITAAAAVLQKRALIRYRRGVITILDRKGLEGRSCGCYFAAVALYRLILGSPSAIRRHSSGLRQRADHRGAQ